MDNIGIVDDLDNLVSQLERMSMLLRHTCREAGNSIEGARGLVIQATWQFVDSLPDDYDKELETGSQCDTVYRLEHGQWVSTK